MTLRQHLEALIATPSISSDSAAWNQSNEALIELLDQWFTGAGFNTVIQPLSGCDDKYNLIASAGSGPDGLVLAGHTDTVPYDEGGWKHDPFRLTESGGRFYGLGVCDMKSFFALILAAIDGLDLATLKQPLTIIATADEETSMCGAKALQGLNRHLGRHVVIGEPTSLKPVRMHKGMATKSLRITGRSGHSSNPALGNSALEGMHTAINEILRWRSELQQRYQNPLFAVDVPTLNLGHIHGGDNPNRICGACELHFDLRPLPGMSLPDLHAELQQRLEQLFNNSGLKFTLEPLFEGIPAMETAETAAIVQAAEALTGYQAESVAFGTEGPYFNAIGMETVILGPGDIAQAHQPDEYLEINRIQPTVDMLRQLIRRFCLE
ncbi:MAG: acetylornithine deacetylase [Pseudomonadota bacterium]